jgi:hypothetical protein
VCTVARGRCFEGLIREARGSRGGERTIERDERRPERELVLERLAGELELRRAPAQVKEALSGRRGASHESFIQARVGRRIEDEDVREALCEPGVLGDREVIGETDGVLGEARQQVACGVLRAAARNGLRGRRPPEAERVELALEKRPAPRDLGRDHEQGFGRAQQIGEDPERPFRAPVEQLPRRPERPVRNRVESGIECAPDGLPPLRAPNRGRALTAAAGFASAAGHLVDGPDNEPWLDGARPLVCLEASRHVEPRSVGRGSRTCRSRVADTGKPVADAEGDSPRPHARGGHREPGVSPLPHRPKLGDARRG